jgi:hypothetical protein
MKTKEDYIEERITARTDGIIRNCLLGHLQAIIDNIRNRELRIIKLDQYFESFLTNFYAINEQREFFRNKYLETK